MRIGIDLRALIKGFHSGIPEYIINIAENILKSEKNSEFRFFYNGLRKEPLSFGWLKAENSRLYEFSFPNKIFELAGLLFKIPNIDKLLGGLDVYFMPHFNLANAECPKVLTFHDLSFIRYPDFFPARKKYWHFSQVPKRQAKEAAHIIAVSESTKNDLMEFFNIPESKVSVVYHGISDIYLSDYSKIELDEMKKKFILSGRFLPDDYILYVGTIEPRKNIISLIRAFNVLKQDAKFKDANLVLAGPMGWLHKEIIKAAEESPYKESIGFLGPIEPEFRPLIYHFAKVLVLPSFFEGFGFPPLEAMACGTPTIVSNRSSLPEVTAGAGFLFDPYKIEELIFCLEQILDNEALRQILTEKGRENVKRFSWKKSAAETLGILKKTAEQN